MIVITTSNILSMLVVVLASSSRLLILADILPGVFFRLPVLLALKRTRVLFTLRLPKGTFTVACNVVRWLTVVKVVLLAS